MTPTQTMMKFERKYSLSTKLYERLQAIYAGGLIKDELFTSKELLEREYKLMDTMTEKHPFDQSLAISGLYLFSVWRNNKSIFRFDEDLAKHVVSARVPPDVEAKVLKGIPHWSVYIELPRAAKRAFMNSISDYSSLQILGFWALYDKSVTSGDEWVLKVYLHINDKSSVNGDLVALKPINIPITTGLTITNCTSLAQTDSDCGLTKIITKNTGALNTILSLLLCLCVEDPDVTDVIGLSLTRQQLFKPRYKYIKSRKSFEASIQPHYYEIGLKEGNYWRKSVRKLENDIMTGRSDMDRYMIDGQWLATSSGVVWVSGKINN